MLRSTCIWLSLGNKRPTPFTTAALELCRVHTEYRQRKESAPVGAREDPVLARLEKEFAVKLECLRPVFHASKSMESSRAYAGKLYHALRHFGYTSDPMYEELEALMGRLQRRHRNVASMQWNAADAAAATTSGGPYDSTSELGGGGADDASASSSSLSDSQALRRSSIDAFNRIRARGKTWTPELGPGEQPGPSPDQVAAHLEGGEMHIPFKHRGHWVLREPGIAPTKEERSVDPW